MLIMLEAMVMMRMRMLKRVWFECARPLGERRILEDRTERERRRATDLRRGGGRDRQIEAEAGVLLMMLMRD